MPAAIRIRGRLARAALVFLLALACPHGPRYAVAAPDAGKEKVLRLEARDEPLAEVLERLYRRHGVRVSGLEAKADRPVAFDCRGATAARLLERVFRALGVQNFAFEYEGNRLVRAMAVPSAGPDVPTGREAAGRPAPARGPGRVPVIEVLGVLPDSQAERLELRRGDRILRYDGRRVRQAGELRRTVLSGEREGRVEMEVLRDGEPLRFELERGMIGVQIRTVMVPRDTLGAWDDSGE